MQQAPRYRAGEVEICPVAREVIRGGRPVKVERRAFDLLVYLLAHRDRVVDKDELWREVWQSRPVSDSVIPRAVSKARKALGADSENEWITTVHGVGYRFVYPVTVIEQALKPTASPAPGSAFILSVVLPSLFFLGIVASLAYWWITKESNPPRVAILPVQVEASSQPLEWVQYGVLPLIDQALADDGVPSVSSGTVLATLKRYPEVTDFSEQARILRLNTGAERVLLPRLSMQGGQFLLTVATVDEDQPMNISVVGNDPVLMAVGAGARLTEESGWRRDGNRAFKKVVTDDPFVNEAYARGLDARLRSQWQQAADFFETVLNAAPELHWAKYQLTLATRRLGDWDRTETLNEELLAAASQTGDEELKGSVQTTSGTLAWRRGDLDEAERWYREAKRTFESLDSKHSLASLLGNLAILASLRGDFENAEGMYRKTLEYFRSVGDLYNASAVQKNLGVMFLERGDLQKARREIEASLKVRQDLGLQREATLSLASLADIETRSGRWQDALAIQERVREMARETEDAIFESRALTDQCHIHQLSGRLSESRERCNEALFLARQMGHRSNEAYALYYLATLEQLSGNPARARELANEAFQIYQELDYAQGLASTAQLLFKLEPDLGSAQAKLMLRKAEGYLDAASSEVQSIRWQILAARHHDALGDSDQADQHWLEAMTKAEMLNNPYELLRVQWQYALWQLHRNAPLEEIDSLIHAIESSEINLPGAARVLAIYHHSKGDTERARQAADHWKALSGEAWSNDLEAEFRRLTTQN